MGQWKVYGEAIRRYNLKKEYCFGRNPSTFDARDFNLASFIPPGLPDTGVVSSNWDYNLECLNQDSDPHCVGFSIANFGINEPVNTIYTNADGHKFYYEAKVFDGEPMKENGSTIRSAVKVMKNNGQIDAYAFAPNVETIKWWVLNRGPLVVGTLWTEEMLEPDKDNIIHVDSNVVGGHAYLITSYDESGYFGIQNSWGSDWGFNGKAYISEDDFEKLYFRGGEAIAAVELEEHAKNEPCWQKIKKFFKNLLA